MIYEASIPIYCKQSPLVMILHNLYYNFKKLRKKLILPHSNNL